MNNFDAAQRSYDNQCPEPASSRDELIGELLDSALDVIDARIGLHNGERATIRAELECALDRIFDKRDDETALARAEGDA